MGIRRYLGLLCQATNLVDPCSSGSYGRYTDTLSTLAAARTDSCLGQYILGIRVGHLSLKSEAKNGGFGDTEGLSCDPDSGVGLSI